MGLIRNSQIINNDLTGSSIDRNFRFFDEQEVPISKGEIRLWQSKYWRVKSDISISETGGSLPKEGDLTYSPDLHVDYWQEIPNYGVERIIFESFLITINNINISSMNHEVIVPMAIRMHHNWEVYGENLLFDIRDDGGNFWYGKKFPTMNDFINWYNSETFTLNVHVEIYGLYDGEKGKYHKIYGRNEGLSIIKGNNSAASNYHKNICLFQSNWVNSGDFAVDILERLTGTTPSNSNNAKRCIHIPGNKNMYTLYQTLNTPNNIHFKGGLNSQKRCYNPTTLGVDSIHNDDVFQPILGANAFYRINQVTGDWNFIRVQNISDSEYVNSNSYVKVYGFQREDGAIIAIVKPVGQDSWRLSWKEPLTGKKVMIGYYNNDDKLELNYVEHAIQAINNYDVSFIISKQIINNSIKTGKISKLTMRNIAIFIADGDGYITRVPQTIDWMVKQNGAKAYFLLNNNH